MDELTFLREKLRRELNELTPLIAVGDEDEGETKTKDIQLVAKMYLISDTVNKLATEIITTYVGDVEDG